MAKLKSSKILAGFLAFVMIVGMLPISVFTTVFAAGIDSYSVQLTDGTDVLDLDDVEITMTNKVDESITGKVCCFCRRENSLILLIGIFHGMRQDSLSHTIFFF